MSAGAQLDPRVGQAFFGRFSELRPTQKLAIEAILRGENIVLTAGTGSGKTEASVAPLVSLGWIDAIQRDQTFLLYVCPTKALINDVAVRLRPVFDRLGLRLGIRHGDRDDLSLAEKRHVLITTPESLNVLMMKRHEVLADIRSIVIDEVHLL